MIQFPVHDSGNSTLGPESSGRLDAPNMRPLSVNSMCATIQFISVTSSLCHLGESILRIVGCQHDLPFHFTPPALLSKLKRLRHHHLDLDVLFGCCKIDAGHNPFGPGSDPQTRRPLHIGVQCFNVPGGCHPSDFHKFS